MTFEITLGDEDAKILERYMKETNLSVSEVARQAILEMIFDDDADLAAYNRAVEDYKKNPVTYAHDEVMKKLALS